MHGSTVRRRPSSSAESVAGFAATQEEAAVTTPDEDRPLAVFDIDGVLADVRHRLHLVEGRPKDWDGFFAAAADDPPLTRGCSWPARAPRTATSST
jgi:hypothetical protein